MLYRKRALPKCYMHIWSLCGDCGTDQSALRSSLRTLLTEPRYANQLIFEQPCLKHQLHLACRDMLRLINRILMAHGRSYGYFGSVAKICHTWRAHAVKLSKTWQALIPKPFEYKASCNVPPLAVAGRWGSIDCHAAARRRPRHVNLLLRAVWSLNCSNLRKGLHSNSGSEEFLLHGPPDFVVRAFMATFATRAFNDAMSSEASEQQAVLAALAGCDDELGLEEAQEYRQKVSKWIRGSMECMQDSLFWFTMSAAYKAREPVRHLFGILSKYAKQASRRVKSPHSEPCATKTLPIVDFVTVRLEELDREFVAMRAGICSWTGEVLETLRKMICWNADNAVSRENMEAMMLKLVMLNHASFKRRIHSVFSQ